MLRKKGKRAFSVSGIMPETKYMKFRKDLLKSIHPQENYKSDMIMVSNVCTNLFEEEQEYKKRQHKELNLLKRALEIQKKQESGEVITEKQAHILRYAKKHSLQRLQNAGILDKNGKLNTLYRCD